MLKVSCSFTYWKKSLTLAIFEVVESVFPDFVSLCEIAQTRVVRPIFEGRPLPIMNATERHTESEATRWTFYEMLETYDGGETEAGKEQDTAGEGETEDEGEEEEDGQYSGNDEDEDMDEEIIKSQGQFTLCITWWA
jgi:hypothetical protein